MPGEKKGLSAFIKKQQKNKKPVVSEGQPTSTTEAASQETKAHDIEVGTSQSKGEKNTPAQNKNVEDSSDEEEDDLNKKLTVGNIKEKKDVVNKNANSNENKKGYGLDSDTKKADEGIAAANVIRRNDKKAFGGPVDIKSGITFGGGKPKFGRKKNAGKFGDDFKAGLDDIDDDGNPIMPEKEERSKANSGYGADGGREFINLGSTARGPMTEEQKERESRPAAVKPTFRGKLNLTKMGGAAPKDEETGVKASYDFSVTYKSAVPDGEKRERRNRGGEDAEDEGDATVEKRKDKRQFNKSKQNEKANDFEGDDDGFEIVRNKDRKTKKTHQFSDSSDDEDERPRRFTNSSRGGVRIERGGNRGARGGYFKNSKFEAAKEE